MPNPRERSPLSAAVAATVRAERAVHGWSQKDLAERSGVSYDSIRRIESGERVADVSQTDRLAHAFGLSLTQLIQLAQDRITRENGTEQPPSRSTG